MKMLTAILVFAFAISAMATTEIQTFFYDGSQDSVQMSLQSEATHTEYRYEQRRTTCFRQQVFYRTICRSTPSGRICQTVPEYRTIAYSCIETIRIPYEVKDYDVQAFVNLDISSLEGATPGESFEVTLDGDNLSLSAVGSRKYFILLTKKEISSRVEGPVKFIDANFTASLVDASPVTNALSIQNISLKGSDLFFDMGPIELRELIGFKLNITKSPILGSDKVLFDRELKTNEIKISSSNSSSEVTINIQNLGVRLSSGRFKITPKAYFKHKGSILNASQFERTEVSSTLIYKNR